MAAIFTALSVVDDSTAANVGGSGARQSPPAPAVGN
jgi:hypothetical protein